MRNEQRSLYVVVRHSRNPAQTFKNVWLDDDRLLSITTTDEIGRLCLKAQRDCKVVYVHRCGWDKVPPTICCSVSVQHVQSIPGSPKVTFSDCTVLNNPPAFSPERGQSFYNA